MIEKVEKANLKMQLLKSQEKFPYLVDKGS